MILVEDIQKNDVQNETIVIIENVMYINPFKYLNLNSENQVELIYKSLLNLNYGYFSKALKNEAKVIWEKNNNII